MSARTTAIAALLVSLMTLPAYAQANANDAHEAGSAALQQIYDALRTGNVESLIDVAAERMDLTIFGSSELLSRSQSKFVVKEFFRTYPPTRLDVHETSPSDGNWFASASYWYVGGDGPLTVYLRMRAKGVDGWELRELRFRHVTAR